MPVTSYHAALAAGYMALQAMCGPNGPREGLVESPLFISPSMESTLGTLQ
jgi:hypothetical protein